MYHLEILLAGEWQRYGSCPYFYLKNALNDQEAVEYGFGLPARLVVAEV
jgi:hypothetical protein